MNIQDFAMFVGVLMVVDAAGYCERDAPGLENIENSHRRRQCGISRWRKDSHQEDDRQRMLQTVTLF